MSRHKRRFETLEDRRLLSMLAAAPVSSAASPAAEIATPASAATPSASTTAADTSGDSTPGDAADNPGEYANASPTGGSQADSYQAQSDSAAGNAGGSSSSSTSPGYGYASSTYDNSYSGSYAASTPYYYSTKQPSSPLSNSASAGQPTATLPMLQLVNSSPIQGTTADAFAALLPNSASAPAAAGSAPAARSPSSESLKADLEASAAIAEPVASPVTEGMETLMAPVAVSELPSEWDRVAERSAAIEEWYARAEPLLPAAEAGARSLLVGSVGVTFASLADGIDAVFEGFDRLGSDAADHAQVCRIGQWLILAGGACAAFEYARARYREGGAWQATGAWPILCEPRLRRRWFAPRSLRG